MYLKPRAIFERFLVQERKTSQDEVGRQVIEFVPTGKEILGVLSTLTPLEREKFKGRKIECTHSIVQRLGTFKAKVGDKLVSADRSFLVDEIDNPGGLSQWFVYKVTERFDLK